MDPALEPTTGPIETGLAEMSQSTILTAAVKQDDERSTDHKDSSTKEKETKPSVPIKKEDAMDNLVLELKRAISDPGTSVADGYAPVPFVIGFEPSPKHSDQHSAFSELLGMSAVIRMFAAINVLAARDEKKRTSCYSITEPKEYVAAFNEGAEAITKALTVGPLTGFYDSSGGGNTQTEEQLLKRSEIHAFVLSRILSGIPIISKEHMHNLDQILTHFVALVNPFKPTTTSDQPSLKHAILVNYIKVTDITGTGDMLVIDAYTRLVTLTLEVDDWVRASHKPGILKRNEKIKFGMTTTIIDFKLDAAKYRQGKSKYQQALETMINEEPELKKTIENGGLEAFGRDSSTIWPVEKEVFKSLQ